MIRSLLKFSYQYPRSILLFLVTLAILAAPLLQNLQYDISAQSLMVKSDPAWDTYQQLLQDFGSDSVTLIVISDEDLLQQEKLEQVKQLNQQLKALDFVKGSSSLFNVPNIKDVDGYIESKPFLLEIPQGRDQAQQLLSEALANPLVAQNLISQDGKTLSINLFIDDSDLKPGEDSEIAQAIEQVLAPFRIELDTVYQMSSSSIRDEISRQIQLDMQTILPAGLGVLILVLGLSMGRLNCSIVPFSSAVLSIVLMLSFMAYMQIPLNVLTSIIPAMLIIIGSTEDVHLMAEYHVGVRQGLSRSEAVARIPVNQSLAIMLAFVTTFVGFLSITLNDLQILREFGWLVSFGLLINFVITILFVPAYLSLFGGTSISLQGRRNAFQKIAGVISSISMRFKKTTLMALLLIAGYFLWGAQFLQVNNNTLAYFSEDSSVMQRMRHIHEQLSGMQTFSIVLDSSIEGTFQKVRYLEELERLQRFIDERAVFDKTLSFADFIKLTHQVMEGTSQPQLPLEDEVVQVYMEFVQFDAVSSYVTQDFSKTRLLVRHNIGESSVLKKEFKAIEDFIANDLRSSLKVTLTGESVLNNRAADAMAIGQMQSLLLMVVVILLLVSLLFIDLRAGLIALIPNVFPVIVLFGVMGYFQIPLDSGTTMVAVIALGICVDDTIHFLSRYHFFTRGTDNTQQALRQTVEHEATPITTTSIALALGFLTLTLSSFKPVVYFGALSALVMIMAMFANFVLTPILLSFTKLVTVWDMLSINLKSDVLKNSPIFHGLKNFQIKQAILSGIIRRFSKGDVIIDQGAAGNELYVLLEGLATATHRDEDGSVHTLGELKAGDLFGEVAQLSQRDRMARVTAKEPVQVLEIKWDDIQSLGRFHPRISMRLYRNLAKILSKRVVEITEEKGHAHDELTGALTRSYLCKFLEQEVKRSHYVTQPLSLILLDIDVDSGDVESSHDLSDKVVSSVTTTIKRQLQPIDIFARWDECSFMLILPGSDEAQSVKLAQTLQQAIELSDMNFNADLHIHAAVTQVLANDRGQDVIQRLESQLMRFKQSRKSLKILVA